MPPRTRTEALINAQDDPTAVAPWETGAQESTTTSTVATRHPLTGEIVSATSAVDNLIEWVMDELEARENDPRVALSSIIGEIMMAGDAASILREKLPVAGQEFVGRPFLLNDFTIIPTDFDSEDGCPAYASMRVTDLETHEDRIVNCGGWSVVAQCRKLRDLNAFPVQVSIVEGRAKKGKNPPLKLVDAS